ncbi:MAG: hypothetical protein QM727_00455 [Niabella sp.]
MKKFLILALAAASVVTYVGCNKSTNNTPPCTSHTLEQDRVSIDSFKNATGASYLEFKSDYYCYIGVADPGTGSKAAADSLIAFKRTISTFYGNSQISVTSDSVYRNDGRDLRASDLQGTTDGIYRYFINNVNEGGTVRIIYPSSANSLGAYGCQQLTTNDGKNIPAYSQVIVDLKLTSVKKGS